MQKVITDSNLLIELSLLLFNPTFIIICLLAEIMGLLHHNVKTPTNRSEMVLSLKVCSFLTQCLLTITSKQTYINKGVELDFMIGFKS